MKGKIIIEAIPTPEEFKHPGMSNFGVAIEMDLTEVDPMDRITTVFSLCKSFRFTKADLAALVLLFENPGGGLVNSMRFSIPNIQPEGRP